MKWIETYNKLGLTDNSEVFANLVSTLKPSNMLWTYFVNWDKVMKNTRELEVNLNILNYLIGKDDFESEFKIIVRQHPSVVSVLPALAVRDGENSKIFQIISSIKNRQIVYESFDFTTTDPSDEDIEKYLEFVTKTGIKELFSSNGVKNLVDYVLGVEAGIDSNGRKNRSGHSMEAIVESFVSDFCSRNGAEYLKEANAVKIKTAYGIDVPVDKSSRRYDFVINYQGKLSLS
jgi:type II restriction enzyme